MARVLSRVSWQIKDFFKNVFDGTEIKINEKIDFTLKTSSSSQFPRAKYEHSVLLSIHHLSISKYIFPPPTSCNWWWNNIPDDYTHPIPTGRKKNKFFKIPAFPVYDMRISSNLNEWKLAFFLIQHKAHCLSEYYKTGGNRLNQVGRRNNLHW